MRRPALDPVGDREINGAAAARNVAFDRARSDVLLCVDDDMEPAPDALERLVAHLMTVPQLAAVTPVITNYEAPALSHRLVSTIFSRGPFRDDRQPVYWRGAPCAQPDAAAIRRRRHLQHPPRLLALLVPDAAGDADAKPRKLVELTA